MASALMPWAMLSPLCPRRSFSIWQTVATRNWVETPYPALGRAAYDARGAEFALGSEGAGTGANVAGVKGGIGSASAVLPSGATVGALVAVNAIGEVTQGDTPHFWAAPFEQAGEFGNPGPAMGAAPSPRTKAYDTGNTTIAIVATDLTLDKAQATRMAIAAHDGMARAIVPSHTTARRRPCVRGFDRTSRGHGGRRAASGATRRPPVLPGPLRGGFITRARNRGIFNPPGRKSTPNRLSPFKNTQITGVRGQSPWRFACNAGEPYFNKASTNGLSGCSNPSITSKW